MHNRRPERRSIPAINGPEPEEIADAFEEFRHGEVTDLPSVNAVRVLEEASIGFPVTVGYLRILDARITRGEPRHGAKRSDDHISGYEVEYPEKCPEADCHSERTRYKYSANGFEFGYEKTFCPSCETVHDSEEWG